MLRPRERVLSKASALGKQNVNETEAQAAGRERAEDIAEEADDMGVLARIEFMESFMATLRENYCFHCWGTTLPCHCWNDD